MRSASFALFLILLPATQAHAYVDPGSGSVIVTTILGLLAAIGYTFRKYFYRMRRMLGAGSTPDPMDKEI